MSTSDELTLYHKIRLEEVFSVNFDTTCYLCKKTIAIGRVEIGIDKEGKKEVRVYNAMNPHNCSFASEDPKRDN